MARVDFNERFQQYEGGGTSYSFESIGVYDQPTHGRTFQYGEKLNATTLAGMRVRITTYDANLGKYNYSYCDMAYVLAHTGTGIGSFQVILNGTPLSTQPLTTSGQNYLYIYYNSSISGQINTVWSFDVVSPSLLSLYLANVPGTQKVGGTLDLSNLVVKGHYSQGDDKTITGWIPSIESGHKFTEYEVGTNTLTISYDGQSVSTDFDVVGLDYLEVNDNNVAFKKGQTYTRSLTVKAYYTDGHYITLNSGNYTIEGASHSSGSIINNTGDFSYKVKFKDTSSFYGTNQELTEEIFYHVYDLVSIARTGSGNLEFEAGDYFSFSEGITADYGEETVELEPSDCLFNGVSYSSFCSIPFGESSIGSGKSVEVSYTDPTSGTTKKFLLGYSVVGLTSISAPSSERYFVGQTFPGTIQTTATYSDGTTFSVSATVTSSPNMSTAGTKDVTISYTEGGITKQKTYQINVEAIAVEEIIEVVSSPIKTTYKTGETFDKSGLVVKVKYNDDSTGNIVPDSTNYDGKEFTLSDYGTGTLKVNVGSITSYSTSIQIKCIKPTSISLHDGSHLGGEGANHDEYDQGTNFNANNIKVDVTYSDGSIESNVNPTSISPANGSKLDTSDGTKTVTITFTKGDASVTLSKTLYIKKLKVNLSVTGPLKTLFNFGEQFSLGTGIVIKAQYEGTHFADKTLSASDYTIDFAVGSYIKQKSSRVITIKYGISSYSYTIVVKYLDHLENITGYKASFYKGDYFELGTCFVDAIYKYTDDREDTLSTIPVTFATVNCNFSGTTRLTDVGTQNVNIKYTDSTTNENASITYSISVLEDIVTGIELDITTEQIEIGGNKLLIHHFGDNYVIGETISNGNLITLGNTTYTISEDEHITLTHDGNDIVSETLTDDDLVQATRFFEDYTPFYKTNKVAVIATRLSGKTDFITSNEYTTDKQSGSIFLSTGTHPIEVSYEGHTQTYNVTVIEHEIESIEVTAGNNVKKIFAIGDEFNFEGLVVKAVYNSGYKQTLENGASGYSTNPAKNYKFEDSDLGTQGVTVSYHGFTAGYDVSVVYPEVDYAEVITTGVNLQPRRTDVFATSNISVIMHYKNGLTKQLERILNNTPTQGKFYANVDSLSLDGDSKVQAAVSSDPYKVTITSWDYYRLSGTGYAQTNEFSVVVLPSGSLNSIYIDGTNAKKTYKTGETFTGEGFVIMQKLDDYDDYVPTDVSGNANVVTNPALGSVLYSAGQVDVTFQYRLNNIVKEATYTISVIPSYSKTNAITESIKIVRLESIDNRISLTKSGITYDEASNIQKNRDGFIWALFNKNDTEIVDGERTIKAGLTNIKCYGYVIQGSRTSDTDITIDPGKVVLFQDYEPVIQGDSNITVTFRRTVLNAAKKINLCRNIILYGYKTNRNRAFVSVNPSLGSENVDYRSEPINIATLEHYDGIADGDLTYFPDTNYTEVGGNSNRIIGEAILNNGYMIILKSDSKQEPTIYFRHSEIGAVIKADGSTAYDFNGNQLQEERYPVEPGNIGDGGLSMFGILNFYGDTVFMTKKGLRGISVGSAQSLTDDTKYSTPRTKLIDNKLQQEGLQNSHLYKFNDYLIIAVNTHLYVGYKYDYGFEWFYFDNCKADVLYDFDEELYFANEEGALCKFNFKNTYKQYVDKSRVFIGEGGVAPIVIQDTNNANTIVFNYAKYKDFVQKGNKLSIISSDYNKNIYALIGKFINKYTLENKGYDSSNYEGIIDRENGYLKLLPNTTIEENGRARQYNIRWLLTDRKVYLDQLSFVVPTTRNAVGVPYTLTTKDAQGNDLPTDCFLLVRDNGEYVDLNNLEICRISFQIEDSEIDNVEVDDVNQTVTCQLRGDHDLILDLIQYDSQSTDAFKGVITKGETVKCHYITKPLNCDEPNRVKHIKSTAIINDSGLNSVTDLGYILDSSISKKAILEEDKNTLTNSQVSAIQTDLDNMSFEEWTYDVTDMPKQHRSYREIEDVECICFVFKNYKDTNMVLTNLNVQYTIGVKGE